MPSWCSTTWITLRIFSVFNFLWNIVFCIPNNQLKNEPLEGNLFYNNKTTWYLFVLPSFQIFHFHYGIWVLMTLLSIRQGLWSPSTLQMGRIEQREFKWIFKAHTISKCQRYNSTSFFWCQILCSFPPLMSLFYLLW